MVVEIPMEIENPTKIKVVLLVPSQEQKNHMGQSTKKEQCWSWMMCPLQKRRGNYQPCFPKFPLHL